MGFLMRYFLISRAAFDTLEEAKHWTAFHVAQTIVVVLRDVERMERRPVLCSIQAYRRQLGLSKNIS